MHMAGRKAITTIIAVLLVVAITLAVALSAFTFIQKTQRSAQGITETSTSGFLQRAATCGKLVSFKFNPVTNISEAVLRNCGFRDIDLSNDNLQIMVKTQDKSCVFKLNSTNCPNCVGKLGIGSFIALQINTSAVYCASTLADLLNAVVGQNVNVVLADKSASFSTATTFVPEPIVVCGTGLSPIHPCLSGGQLCFNYTLSNTGNAKDNFTVYDITMLGFGNPVCKLYNATGCSADNYAGGSFTVALNGAPTGTPPYDSYNYSVFLNFTGVPGTIKQWDCQVLIKENNCNRELIEMSHGNRTTAC